MKIIHTSDWHLGQVLYGHDREADHAAALARLAKIVEAERPDALVVSGDIFHGSTPSAAATSLLSRALVALRRVAPSMPMVLTAGNHDSASRHEQFATAWAELSITTIGTIPGADEIDDDAALGRLIVPVEGRGWIVAVPFVARQGGALPTELMKRLLDRVAALNSANLPVVMMAHAAVGKFDPRGHDMAIIGGLESAKLSDIPAGSDYLALGHIHKSQTLGKRAGGAVARYAGSLCQVSFDEDYAHSVSVVTIEAHGAEPRVTTIEIPPLHPLATIGGDAGLQADQALETLTKAVTDTDSPLLPGTLLRLTVALKADQSLPADLTEAAAKIADDAGHALCQVKPVRPDDIHPAILAQTLTDYEVQHIGPIPLAEDYARRVGREFTPEMAQMLQQLYDELQNRAETD